MTKAIVIKYNNAFDIFKSLETGIVQVKGAIKSQAGDILVFNDTSNGSYIVGGIVIKGRTEVETSVNWFDTTEGDYTFEHQIKTITPVRVFTKEDFETKFPNSRTLKEGSVKGVSFHHTIELDEVQLEALLS